MVVGRLSFLPFPGELKQTPLTLKLIDCICNWWVDQAQYCYSKSIEWAREKFIKLIKIPRKYWSQKWFSAGCRNIVCKPHVWDIWSTATKKLSNKTEQVVLFVTFDVFFFLWCYFMTWKKMSIRNGHFLNKLFVLYTNTLQWV